MATVSSRRPASRRGVLDKDLRGSNTMVCFFTLGIIPGKTCLTDFDQRPSNTNNHIRGEAHRRCAGQVSHLHSVPKVRRFPPTNMNSPPSAQVSMGVSHPAFGVQGLVGAGGRVARHLSESCGVPLGCLRRLSEFSERVS